MKSLITKKVRSPTRPQEISSVERRRRSITSNFDPFDRSMYLSLNAPQHKQFYPRQFCPFCPAQTRKQAAPFPSQSFWCEMARKQALGTFGEYLILRGGCSCAALKSTVAVLPLKDPHCVSATRARAHGTACIGRRAFS